MIKRQIGGKWVRVNDATGYFGRNDAGNKREIGQNDAGIKREFVGSKTKEYTFSDTIHGTHTITANSYQEALRIAESMGYTRSDYKKR